MFQYFSDLYNNFINYIISIWNDFVEFLTELPIKILNSILDALASLIESIPVPDFISNNGINTAINSISPDILYFVSMSGMDNAMAVIASGFAFRLLRKLFTLGQW